MPSGLRCDFAWIISFFCRLFPKPRPGAIFVSGAAQAASSERVRLRPDADFLSGPARRAVFTMKNAYLAGFHELLRPTISLKTGFSEVCSLLSAT